MFNDEVIKYKQSQINPQDEQLKHQTQQEIQEMERKIMRIQDEESSSRKVFEKEQETMKQSVVQLMREKQKYIDELKNLDKEKILTENLKKQLEFGKEKTLKQCDEFKEKIKHLKQIQNDLKIKQNEIGREKRDEKDQLMKKEVILFSNQEKLKKEENLFDKIKEEKEKLETQTEQLVIQLEKKNEEFKETNFQIDKIKINTKNTTDQNIDLQILIREKTEQLQILKKQFSQQEFQIKDLEDKFQVEGQKGSYLSYNKQEIVQNEVLFENKIKDFTEKIQEIEKQIIMEQNQIKELKKNQDKVINVGKEISKENKNLSDYFVIIGVQNEKAKQFLNRAAKIQRITSKAIEGSQMIDKL